MEKKFINEEKKRGPWSPKVNKIKTILIEDSSLDGFTQLILSNFKVGVRYSVLFRVKYDFCYYGMLGHQQGLYLNNNKDIDSIYKLHKDLQKMLRDFKDYGSGNSVDEIEQLEMWYIVLKDNPDLKLKDINDIKLNRSLVNVKESKEKFSDKFLPLTMDTSYFGKLLVGNKRDIYFSLINEHKELLNQDEIDIHNIESMYLYKEESIVINRKPVNDSIKREMYSAYTGKFIKIVEDINLGKDKFSRKISNLTLTISKSKIISLECNKNLNSIKYIPRKSDFKDVTNPFIGSFDLEAFEDLDSLAKVYAVGFMALDDMGKFSKEPETFYLNKDQSNSDLLLDCINLMLEKYGSDEYIFYTHNFGKYDSVFVLNILKMANNKLGYDYYELDPLWRDGKLLSLGVKVVKFSIKKRIKKYGVNIKYLTKLIKESEGNIKNIEKLVRGDYIKTKSEYSKITFVDSYNLLNGRLYDLSHSFGLDVTKGHFPHKFVRKDTLNYIGNTPSLEYWKSVQGENIPIREYKEQVKKDWCLKDECIIYLKKDLESLLKVMNTFNKYILQNYWIQMTDSVTISRLALNIFLKHYLKDYKLPIIGSDLFNDIKEAYFGGITDVYKPYGKNLFLYDVNSLFPFASLNPLPGNKCTKLEDFSRIGLNLNNLFGFFYCEVEVSNNYLGLLPVRTEEGLIMPNGKWAGWYFSEELKFAHSQGYKIKVIKGYNFNKLENVFNEFVNTLYNLKAKSTGAIKIIVKMLLNSLIGRFGMKINKPITEIVDWDKLESLWESREFEGPPKKLTDEEYIITYYPEISKKICESHYLDYNKVLKADKNVEKSKQIKDVSLTTAASVTSYARIYMSKIKLDILNKGGHIYYTDTDSIVTDIPLDKSLVGPNLGQFKLEYEIKEGYFISAKTYCLVLKNNSLIVNMIKSDVLKTGGHIYSVDTDSIVTDIPLDESLINSKLKHIKLEYEIKEGYINSTKTYCIIFKGNPLVIKTKGLYNHSLSLKDFKNLYKGVPVTGYKVNTITVLNEGSVILGTKPITLDPDSYKKREKIYRFGKWIDTKPLMLNSYKLSEYKSIIPKNTKSLKKKLLINNITKRSFSSYISKSIKTYRRYILKKFIDKIVDILVYLFILFLLSIILLIYFIFSQFVYLNNINDITNNINGTTDELDLIKSNINNTELTDFSLWKQKLNNFVYLFKDDRKNIYNFKIKCSNNLIEYQNFEEPLLKENSNNQNINIINELHKFHYNELYQEIDSLNNEISELKIKLLNYKVDKLDTINFVKNIVDEMDNEWKQMNKEFNRLDDNLNRIRSLRHSF